MTSRRDFLLSFTMAASAVSFLRPLNVFATGTAASGIATSAHRLTILHTSNLQGQLSALGASDKMFELGGLDNIGKKIANIRKEDISILTVHTGTIVGNTQNLQDQLHIYKEMFTAGYDVVVPGQKDIFRDSAQFKAMSRNVGLLAIAPLQLNLSAGILPFEMLTKSYSKIGVINADAYLQGNTNLELTQTAGAITKTAQLLKNTKRCSVIVCIVQRDKAESRTLAALSSGIDIILSATETSLLNNAEIGRDKNNNEVLISYAGAKGTMMSRIDLTFNSTGEKVSTIPTANLIGVEKESSLSLIKKYGASSIA